MTDKTYARTVAAIFLLTLLASAAMEFLGHPHSLMGHLRIFFPEIGILIFWGLAGFGSG